MLLQLDQAVHARHANASLVWLRLTQRAEAITLTVQDNGGGLPGSHTEGSGIRGMRERAMLARGRS